MAHVTGQQECQALLNTRDEALAPSTDTVLETAGLLHKGPSLLDDVISQNSTIRDLVQYTHDNHAHVQRINADLTHLARWSADHIKKLQDRIDNLESRCKQNEAYTKHVDTSIGAKIEKITENISLLWKRMPDKPEPADAQNQTEIQERLNNVETKCTASYRIIYHLTKTQRENYEFLSTRIDALTASMKKNATEGFGYATNISKTKTARTVAGSLFV